MATNAATVTAIDGGEAMQQALDTLEEDIVFGRLHPRERLTEDALMARFGLKRHVVRQALAELELMGVVERKRNVGAVVRASMRMKWWNSTHCARCWNAMRLHGSPCRCCQRACRP